MYFAYLFNTHTGEIQYSHDPKDTRAILAQPNWVRLSQDEFERIELAIKWAKAR